MDLSFHRFEKDTQVSLLPSDLAVLMVGIAARQAASPTAAVQARLGSAAGTDTLLEPAHGAFNAKMAGMLRSRKAE